MCMYAYLLYIISQYWVRLRYLSGLESSSGSGLHSYFSFGYIGSLQSVQHMHVGRRINPSSPRNTLRDRLWLCSVTSARGMLLGRDAMLIILIKEKQVWINKIQMRVRLIDLRVQGGHGLEEQRIMRCREDRWTELTRKTG